MHQKIILLSLSLMTHNPDDYRDIYPVRIEDDHDLFPDSTVLWRYSSSENGFDPYHPGTTLWVMEVPDPTFQSQGKYLIKSTIGKLKEAGIELRVNNIVLPNANSIWLIGLQKRVLGYISRDQKQIVDQHLGEIKEWAATEDIPISNEPGSCIEIATAISRLSNRGLITVTDINQDIHSYNRSRQFPELIIDGSYAQFFKNMPPRLFIGNAEMLLHELRDAYEKYRFSEEMEHYGIRFPLHLYETCWRYYVSAEK